jgi:hypothetical protein
MQLSINPLKVSTAQNLASSNSLASISEKQYSRKDLEKKTYI